jgi:hypothetical protein
MPEELEDHYSGARYIMSLSKKIALPLIAAGVIAGMSGAQAAVVTTNTFTVVETFASFDNLVTQGSTSLGGGLSVTSTIDSTIGATDVDLGANGLWGAGDNFAGIGNIAPFQTSPSYDGSMTFALGGGYAGVGATFSIYQADGAGTASILLEALSFSGTVLESTSFTLNINDASLYNVGQFYGFQRGADEIFSFRVSGDGFVLDDVSVAPVPLPAGLPLLVSGLLGAFGAFRRRRATAA